MTVGTRIVEARTAKGWDRKDLVAASGVPYPTLSGIENGDQSTSSHIPALAYALEVNALWLASGRGERATGGSQPVRLTASMIVGAYRMARTAIEAGGMTGFNPETEPEDAALLALALETVIDERLTEVTDSDVLKFVVEVGGRKDAGGSDRSDGGAGGGAGAAEVGAKGRASGSRRRA